MKKSKNFRRDLDIGSKGEVLLIDLLTKTNLNPVKNTDRANLKYWDVRAQHKEKELTFEVKYDLYSARSGNIAIEFFNPKTGKLSGLTATTALFWTHVLPDNSIWLSYTEKLKRFCAETSPLKVIAAGGDDNSSMYLYKKDLILPAVFVKIDEANLVSVLELYLNGNICQSSNCQSQPTAETTNSIPRPESGITKVS